jgi:RimJ/RimL family protein N-acetyltransferase
MNPILREFPDHFTTERLLIRSPRPGDGAAVNAAVRESLDRLKPWLDWAQVAPTIEETEAHCRRAHARFLLRDDLALHLYLRDTGEFVGGSGLHRIDWDVPKFEIGYWLRNGHEGKGLMTEAVDGVAAFAFEGLGANRVEIRCDPRNVRSANVAARCGFTREGTLRNDKRDADGSLRDTAIYARTRQGDGNPWKTAHV